MSIRALTEFAAEHPALPPPYYATVHLRYVIDLDDSGRLRAVLDNGNQRRLWRRPAPSVGRTAGIRPLLLADTVEYTFGLPHQDEQQVRASACRAAYVALLQRCYDATGLSALRAVLRYLEQAGRHAPFSDDCDRRALVTFRVNGRLVIDAVEIQQFWAALQVEQAETRLADCSVCRQAAAIPRRSSERVRGLPGAATVGSPLITVNLAAAESHGLANAHVTGVCSECLRLAGWALDYLLDQPGATLSVSAYTAVFWLSTRQPLPLTTLLAAVSYEDVDRVRRQLQTLQPQTEIVCLGLTSQGGRIRLLDFFRVPVSAALGPLDEWIAVQAGHDDSGTGRLVGIHQLASTYSLSLRPPRPGLVQALIRRALLGEEVPAVEAAAVLHAALIEPPLNRARRALFQLCWPVGGHYQPTPADHQSRAFGRLIAFAERLRARARDGRTGTIRLYRAMLADPQRYVPGLIDSLFAAIADVQRDDPSTAGRAAALLRRYVAAVGSAGRRLPAVPFLRGYLHEYSQPDFLIVRSAANVESAATFSSEASHDSSGDLRTTAPL
jgi:hypothetical protein